MTRTFDTKWLRKELQLPWSAIYDEIVTNTRWSIIHKCVFELDGKFWMVRYSVGATESQFEDPWDYEETIEGHTVELKDVVVKQWVETEDGRDNGIN